MSNPKDKPKQDNRVTVNLDKVNNKIILYLCTIPSPIQIGGQNIDAIFAHFAV